MEDIISSLSTYGYLFLFFYSLGGGFVALAVAGLLSSMGKLDIVSSIAIATIANFLGDMLIFYFTKYNKKDIHQYIKNHRRKLAYAHLLIKKYGSGIIFIKKYIYGVKTLVPIAIALTKYDAKKFIVLNVFASITWGLVVGSVSYIFGDVFIDLVQGIGEYSYIIIIFVVVFIYIFYKHNAK